VAKCDEDIKVGVEEEMMDQYTKIREGEIEVFSKLTDEGRRQKFLASFREQAASKYFRERIEELISLSPMAKLICCC
jgi:hypothetical protein